MANLTKKQEEFCIHFSHSNNASEAYRLSYNAKNMKSETVHRRAHELAHNGKIRAMVEYLRNEEFKRISLEYAIEKDKVIREYIRLAFADVRKLFDKKGRLRDVHDLDDDTAAAVVSIEVASSLDGETTTYNHKIKLLEKHQPLKDLAKMLGLFERGNNQKDCKERNLNLQVNFVEPAAHCRKSKISNVG